LFTPDGSPFSTPLLTPLPLDFGCLVLLRSPVFFLVPFCEFCCCHFFFPKHSALVLFCGGPFVDLLGLYDFFSSWSARPTSLEFSLLFFPPWWFFIVSSPVGLSFPASHSSEAKPFLSFFPSHPTFGGRFLPSFHGLDPLFSAVFGLSVC